MSVNDPKHRRHLRYGVGAVSGHFMLPLEVRILNMSLTGLAVEALLPLEIGGRHHLTLRHGEDVIQVPTEVVRCRPVQAEGELLAEAPPRYEVGLDYRGALDEKARELLGFLQHTIVIRAEGMTGRFRIAGADAADSGCRIRELSFAGALIETEQPAEPGDACAIEVRSRRLELRLRGQVTQARRLQRSSGEWVCEVRIAFGELDRQSQELLEEMVTDFLE